MDKLSRKTQALQITGLLLACVLLFANTFSNEFVTGDDTRLINDNRYIRSSKNIPLFFTPYYWNALHPFKGERQYRPIRTTTFALDYFFWQDDPVGYHLTNLLLHTGNVVLVYCLVLLLIGVARPDRQSMDSMPAPLSGYTCAPEVMLPFLTALFFAAHPVHAEAITFVKNRSELLAGLFFLSSLLIFVRYISPTAARGAGQNGTRSFIRRGLDLPAALVCFVLALGSKEMAITLPSVLILYAICFLPGPARWKAILKTIPFWGVAGLFLGMRYVVFDATASSVATFPDSPWQSGLTVLQTFGYYFYLLLFPVKLHVNHLFRLPLTIWEPSVFFSAMASVSLGMLALMLFKRTRRLPCFGLGWLLLTLLPASNLVYLSFRPIAEQRLYLPSIGFCLLLALAFRGLCATGAGFLSRKITLVLLVAMIFMFYSVQTIRRNYDWRDSLTFYSQLVDRFPQNPRAHLGLGDALMSKNRFDEAINQYYYALQLDPDYSNCHCNLANALMMEGFVGEAIRYYFIGLSLQPDDPELHYNLAVALTEQGRFNEAMQHYRQALKIFPDFSEALYNLGVLLAMNENLDEATDSFNAVLRLAPDNADAYRSLGMIAAKRDHFQEAIEYYNASLAIDANNAGSHFGLGIALAGSGHAEEAIVHYRLALKHQPDYADAHYNLGLALAEIGLLREAADHLEAAIRGVPGDTAAASCLTDIYKQLGGQTTINDDPSGEVVATDISGNISEQVQHSDAPVEPSEPSVR